jgi:hypothetical protein
MVNKYNTKNLRIIYKNIKYHKSKIYNQKYIELLFNKKKNLNKKIDLYHQRLIINNIEFIEKEEQIIFIFFCIKLI